MTLQQAVPLAIMAHEGQTRKDGLPYVTHPLTVSSFLSTEDEKVVGVLHDIIEDTEATLHLGPEPYVLFKSVKHPLTPVQANALYKLTHRDDQSYDEYIDIILTDKVAIKVKLADIFHNISDNPSVNGTAKYRAAFIKLLKSLN